MRATRRSEHLTQMGDSAGAMDISVVIPCYRAAELADESVHMLREALPRIATRWEVIVVDDGGGDFHEADWSTIPGVRLVRLPNNRGKGAAVRAGLLSARG